MSGPLDILRRIIMYAKDQPDFLEAIKHIRSRRPPLEDTNEWNKVAMANEMASNMVNKDVRTHAFVDQQGRVQGAYQLDGKSSVPYLVSDIPGLGSQLLNDAYFMSPTRPLSLHAIPGSEDFYRKQKGWVESQEDGIPKFQRNAQGGLVQCGCRRK